MAKSVRRIAHGIAFAAMLAWSGFAPASAWAAGGLPDGRVYEQVSPVEKGGNQAGASGGLSSGTSVSTGSALATADGNGVLYTTSGPLLGAHAGSHATFVSRRSANGWSTSDPFPGALTYLKVGQGQFSFLPSANLSHMFFFAPESLAPGDVATEEGTSSNVFVSTEGAPAEWVGRPTIPDPTPALGSVKAGSMTLAGGSSNLTTVYFDYCGTLVEQDASRAQNGTCESGNPWGFYEWSDGILRAAGELPDHSVSPYGAVSPAEEVGHKFVQPFIFDNQISADGSKAFFLSPDPGAHEACENAEYEKEHPGACLAQLYVRETEGEGISATHRTVLVSRSVLPGHQGQPAPQGPTPFRIPAVLGGNSGFTSYVYASSDGSQALFLSTDRLAKSTAEEEPSGTGPWMYDFDTGTGSLTYLPGVTDGVGGTAAVLAATSDGSRFVFAKETPQGQAVELDLWSGGQVTKIASLPIPSVRTGTNECAGEACVTVAPARAAAEGSVFVFESDSPIGEGKFNNGGGFEQIYRYDATSGGLSCVSCPPAGIVPSGAASLSNDNSLENRGTVVDSRGVSSDGSRVFFDTPDPLVPQDLNGTRDVYEWENGKIYLISSGTSPNPSLYLDSSGNGENVFFATTDGLVLSDVDGGYDVYDARVGGGFPESFVPSACCGDTCQALTGPPALPSLAGGTVGASGNLAPTPAQTPAKPKAKQKKKPKRHRVGKHKRKARKSRAGKSSSKTRGGR